MKSILVVDDEYDIANTLETFLTLQGYLVRSAYNGREALEILKTKPLPQLIISDLMMPEMDGYALIDALQASAEYRHIPVILISAAPLDESRLPSGSWSFFLLKPFDLRRLIVEISVLIGKNQKQRDKQ